MPAVERAATPTRPVPRPRSGALSVLADACPTWPMAALAVIAVMAWVAAAWNDRGRLERQRSEVRLAREPVAAPAATPAAPVSGGAVLR